MTDSTPTRAHYPCFLPIATRWMDNDVYGHINNVVYYAYFDTVINKYLIEEGGLDFNAGPVIGLCVESHCQYMKPVAFPRVVDVGLRVGSLGRSSVRYEVGVFVQGESDVSAHGYFVHVFVDRRTRRSTEIPDTLRAALARIVVAEGD
jgi:acyl-CoA thioester hydrolase